MATLNIYCDDANHDSEGFIRYGDSEPAPGFYQSYAEGHNTTSQNSDGMINAEAHWKFITDDAETGLTGATINSVKFRVYITSLNGGTVSVYAGLGSGESCDAGDLWAPENYVGSTENIEWNEVDITDYFQRSGEYTTHVRAMVGGTDLTCYFETTWQTNKPYLVVDYTPAPTFIPQIVIL